MCVCVCVSCFFSSGESSCRVVFVATFSVEAGVIKLGTKPWVSWANLTIFGG